MANQTVQMNLVINARDEASEVFARFASEFQKLFDSISSGSKGINEALDAMAQASNNMAKDIVESSEAIASAQQNQRDDWYITRDTLLEYARTFSDEFKGMYDSVHNFADLSNKDLISFVESLDNVKVHVIDNLDGIANTTDGKVINAQNEWANTVLMTGDEIKAKFQELVGMYDQLADVANMMYTDDYRGMMDVIKAYDGSFIPKLQEVSDREKQIQQAFNDSAKAHAEWVNTVIMGEDQVKEKFQEVIDKNQDLAHLIDLLGTEDYKTMMQIIEDHEHYSILLEQNKDDVEQVDQATQRLQQAHEKWANTVIMDNEQVKAAFQEIINENEDLGHLMQLNAENDISSMRNLVSELQGVNVVLSETRDNLQEMGDMSVASAGQMVGASMQNAGRGMLGFVKEAVSGAADLQQQLTATAATLNARIDKSSWLSPQQYQDLDNKVMQLAADGKYSATQIGEATYTLAKQNIGYQDIMSGVLQSVKDVAGATDSSLQDSANVISDIIHEFGDKASKEFGNSTKAQFSGIADAISGATHSARISMNDFLNTMKYVGSQASLMNWGVKDVATGIALFGEAGIKGSQAGTTLRRALTNLVAPTKAGAAMMKELGLVTADGGNVFLDSSGKMLPLIDVQKKLADAYRNLTPAEQEAASKAIFGQYAIAGMTKFASMGADEVQKLADNVSKSGEAAALSDAKWNNTAGKLKMLSGSFHNAMTSIGTSLLPIVDKIAGFLQRLVDAFNNLSPHTQKIIGELAAFGGAILLTAGTILTFVSAIGFLKIGLKGADFAKHLPGIAKFGNGIRMLGATMTESLGPFLAIVAVVALLVAGFIYAYKHSQKFRDEVNGAFNGIKATITAVINAVVPFIQQAFTQIKGWIDKIMPYVAELIETDMGRILAVWSKIWPVIQFLVETVWNGIKTNIKVAIDLIGGIITIFLQLLTGHWGDAFKTLLDTATKIWSDIGEGINNFFNNIWANSKQKLGDFVSWLVDLPGTLAQKGLSAVSSFFNSFANFKPKLPHFKLDGSFSLAPPSVPTLSIDWYAKGGIFNGPQVIGVGEAGPEAVIPIDKLRKMIAEERQQEFMREALLNKKLHDAVMDRSVQQHLSVAGGVGGNRIINININVDGRNKSDKDLADNLARQLRLQMAVVST